VSPRTAARGRTETETKRSSCCAVARKRLGPSRGPRERLPRQPPRSTPRGRDTPTTTQASNQGTRFDCARSAHSSPPRTKRTAERGPVVSLETLSRVGSSLAYVRSERERERRALERAGVTAHKVLDCSSPSSEKGSRTAPSSSSHSRLARVSLSLELDRVSRASTEREKERERERGKMKKQRESLE
jgi:hypothetical protein